MIVVTFLKSSKAQPDLREEFVRKVTLSRNKIGLKGMGYQKLKKNGFLFRVGTLEHALFDGTFGSV